MKIIEEIGEAAMLEQLAEECTELAKAALKMARIIRKENPTPVTEKDAIANIDDAFGALVIAKFPGIKHLHVEKVLPVIFAWCGYRAGESN